jgi:hypothetical protein
MAGQIYYIFAYSKKVNPMIILLGPASIGNAALPISPTLADSLYIVDHKAPRNITNVILDGGLEAGSPNPFWSETSIFGFVICKPQTCSGGINYARSGAAWAWFGGTTLADFPQISQRIILDKEKAILRFWLTIPEARVTNPEADFLIISIDNCFVHFIGAEEAAKYSDYTQVILDVSTCADGDPHTLAFSAVINGGASVLNISSFFVDDIKLETYDPRRSYVPLLIRNR